MQLCLFGDRAKRNAGSYQLSYLGLGIIIRRLLLDSIPPDATYQATAVLPTILESCQEVISFIGGITVPDQELYWSACKPASQFPRAQLTPVSTHHMTNTASLLLRLAMRARKIGSPLDRSALEAANGYLRCLIATHKLTEWDVAGSALRKIVSLLLMAEDELPEVRDVYKEVATALGMPIAGESRVVAHPVRGTHAQAKRARRRTFLLRLVSPILTRSGGWVMINRGWATLGICSKGMGRVHRGCRSRGQGR